MFTALMEIAILSLSPSFVLFTYFVLSDFSCLARIINP